MSEITNKIKKFGYIEITQEWFDKAISNNKSFKERKYVSYKGKRFYIDGKNVKFEYRNNEKEVAQLLQEKFGGIIYTLPKVNYPRKVRTADYKYVNHRLKFNDNIDLKSIKSAGNKVIDNMLKEAKEQANNFVLYFTNPNMTYNEIMKQIEQLYINPYRDWIQTIITIKDNDIRVFKRLKK